jgi:hypothetical protein
MGQLVFQATLGGQVNLVGPNTASTYNINVPAVAGNMVTTGDTGTVTNTMLASSAYTAPGTIGSGTPNTGAFTTLSGSTSVTTPILKSSSSLTLQTNGTTTAVTIDTNQQVGIGVTPSAWGSYTALQIKNAAFASYGNNFTIIGNNWANDKYIISDAASLYQQHLGQHTWYNAASGTAGNAISFTQAMTLDSSGNLLVGTTTSAATNGTEGFRVISAGVPTVQRGVGGSFSVFYNSTNSANIGSISNSGGTLTAYNVSSDYRLKENIIPLTGALERIAQLKPSVYNYKTDPSTQIEGFIAHELAEVVPHAVTGEKDAVDADGNSVYQGVDVSFLVPHLTAAIQELKAELDAAKADIATLKGAA